MYKGYWNSNRQTGSPASAVYTRARQLIVDQEVAPGENLTETRLVELTGVSRTPVREALQRLEADGFVTRASGRGYIVAELSEQDMVNVYQVRTVLEGLAAHAAADSITRAGLGQLEDLYETMENAREAQDDKQLGYLNSQFHRAIAEASGNTYLVTMLDGIYDVFERFRPRALQQPGRRDSAAREHGSIIRALRSGDAERAKQIAEQHVSGALKTRLQVQAAQASAPAKS